MRVGLIEEEQRALPMHDTDMPKHHEELTLAIREVGEDHVAVLRRLPVTPIRACPEQIGVFDASSAANMSRSSA